MASSGVSAATDTVVVGGASAGSQEQSQHPQHEPTGQSKFAGVVSEHVPDLKSYEELYKHFHMNPELSTIETETADAIVKHLKSLSDELEIKTHIGGTGVIAILRNGPGKTVLLRADIDGLPVVEKTGLPYASTKRQRDTGGGGDGEVKGTMHACGHDFHITSLLAATQTLASCRSSWSGTLIALFQPAEERGLGARVMVDDGLYAADRHACPVPDIVLGQHVFPYRSGSVVTGTGPVMMGSDSFRVTVYGRGGHGSMPHRTIDPVVVAAHVVVRLQDIVSREVPPDEPIVVTVGAIQAGHTENIISDTAVLKLNIRSMSPTWRARVLASIRRIVTAECQASNCPKPPLIESTSSFPVTRNDTAVATAVERSFTAHFGPESHHPGMNPVPGSEDFGILGSAVDRPYCFWFFGGVDPATWDEKEKEGKIESDIPVNHSPYFAPVIQPTLRTGVEALVVAALTFLGK